MNATPLHSLLFTDLYQLTMAQAYLAERMKSTAVFELFFRTMPEQRNYIVAAGLDDVLDAIENLHVTDGDISYLRSLGLFSDTLFEWLRSFRFTGDIFAVPEGTIVFPNEPMVQVVAPLPEAQVIETMVLNQIHFQSALASKAARIVTAAGDRDVIDFGSRRAHGSDAALKGARASWLVGAAGTSNVLAGRHYGIPVYGTMAHSYIQSHDDERAAFAAFVQEFPESTLLVDTYDPLEGVRTVTELARRLGSGFRVRSIRLDSGDMAQLAKEARGILDAGGLSHVRILASSDLDEHRIAALLDRDAPIDGFGVGTRMAVSPDAPEFDMAYKLVEYDGTPRVKLSSHKVLYPGRKQVFRHYRDGALAGDVLARYDEPLPGEPLLVPVMRKGRRLASASHPLKAIRSYCRDQLLRLPASLRGLEPATAAYAPAIAASLERDLIAVRQDQARHRGTDARIHS